MASWCPLRPVVEPEFWRTPAAHAQRTTTSAWRRPGRGPAPAPAAAPASAAAEVLPAAIAIRLNLHLGVAPVVTLLALVVP
jgi:hypothetical protein